MKVFRFIHGVSTLVGVALLVLAGFCEDMDMILRLGTWGCVALIPAAVYMLAEKVFGGEEIE